MFVTITVDIVHLLDSLKHPLAWSLLFLSQSYQYCRLYKWTGETEPSKYCNVIIYCIKLWGINKCENVYGNQIYLNTVKFSLSYICIQYSKRRSLSKRYQDKLAQLNEKIYAMKHPEHKVEDWYFVTLGFIITCTVICCWPFSFLCLIGAWMSSKMVR